MEFGLPDIAQVRGLYVFVMDDVQPFLFFGSI